jgi:hypothetical protein
MKLTRSEASSGLWQRIEEHLTRRLAEKRAENDHDKDAIATAKLRGAVAEIKAFLALAQIEPAPEPEADDAE